MSETVINPVVIVDTSSTNPQVVTQTATVGVGTQIQVT